MDIQSETASFGGKQLVITHPSAATGTDMTFGLYLPPHASHGDIPALLYLSGLTCTHANVLEKAGLQRLAAQYDMAIIAPDTSPRGLDLPGEHDDWDFGSGAGFYLNATQSPWHKHYRMESYLLEDLLPALSKHYPINPKRLAVTGHSMGGHGALTLALKNPGLFRSVTAFAPISSPINCPWGQKALKGYLGEDQMDWRAYDTCALLDDGNETADILVDFGENDPFLEDQLKPDLLRAASDRSSVDITIRLQPGYDHSYYFVSSFAEDHVRWAAERLGLGVY